MEIASVIEKTQASISYTEVRCATKNNCHRKRASVAAPKLTRLNLFTGSA
jgi:hypothetical protein